MIMANDTRIIRSPLPDIPIPDVDVWTYLAQTMKQFPNKTGLVDTLSKESITYDDIFNKCETIAQNLLKEGYNTQVPLCIYMFNSIDFVLITLAVWRLGGKVACANAMLTEGEIRQELELLCSDILVCDASTVQTAIKAVKGTKVKKIYTKDNHPGCASLSTLYTKTRNIKLPVLSVNPQEDVAAILFSSGTTGLPKGVEITHRGIVAQIRISGGPEMDGLPRPYGIVYQPLSHVYGLCLIVMHIAWASTAVIMSKFDLDSYFRLVSEYKVAQLYIVPPIAVMFSKSDLVKKYDLSHVQSISSGGAPLSKEVEDDIRGLMGDRVQIRQSWGMTELVSMTCTPPVQNICDKHGLQISRGSVGPPVPNVKLKVINLTTGEPLGPEQQGEICVKADHFMKNYHKNPTATAQTVDTFGWLHTGDVGYYDKNGCVFVVDKIKEIIKYRAYQVAPAELEAMLLTHPAVADAGVTGLPDSVSGEIPLAWVVVKRGHTVTPSDISNFMDGKVAAYKRLRGGVMIVNEIPKSASGKILRREIKKRTLAQIKSAKL